MIGDVWRAEGEAWERFPCDALCSPENLAGKVVYTVKFCRVLETNKKGERYIELSSEKVV